MDLSDPIYQLVEQVRLIIRESDALFGIIFELDADGIGFARWRPLLGQIQDAMVVEGCIKLIGDRAFASHQKGANQLVEIEPPLKWSNQNARWYASIVSQQIDNVARVAIVYEFIEERQAVARQQELERTLEEWWPKEVDLLAATPGGAPWDRLLETCIRHERSALLVGGYSAFLRFDQGLRAVTGPLITSHALAVVAENFASQPKVNAEVPGLRLLELRYGERHWFRVSLLGGRRPQAIIISRPSIESVPVQSCDYATAWTGHEGWLGPLKESIRARERDAILIDGAPPLTWDADGVHPVAARVLSSADIMDSLNQSVEPSSRVKNRDGYEEFGLSLNARHFRAAVFRAPSSVLLVLMREAEKRGKEAV